MKDFELTKVRAEGRVRLLTVVLMLLAVAGGVREYMVFRAPWAEATVIYVRGKDAVVQEAIEMPKVVAPLQDEQAVQPDGAKVFLDYLNETNAELENVVKPESALEKIIVSEEKVETPAHEVIFEDGRIEIYDSEAGVVAVEETGVAEDEIPMQAVTAEERVQEISEPQEQAGEAEVSPKQEAEIVSDVSQKQASEVVPVTVEENAVKLEESLSTDDKKDEAVVNTDENSASVTEEAEEDGVIDMMKEIAARAEEEAKQN